MGLTLIHPMTDAGQDAGDVARGGRGSSGALLTRETLCGGRGRNGRVPMMMIRWKASPCSMMCRMQDARKEGCADL